MSTPGASDEARIAAANAYIEALVTHQADAVPFTPECVRIEQGVKTGFSGDHLRRSLNNGPQFRLIAAASNRQFRVEGDDVVASFVIETKAKVAGWRVIAKVDEKFRIPAGDPRIHHIRAIFVPKLARA
ncbi:hypothetical protein [Mycobacteroides abscessus]|uniref:hypothetical protein n=1 Tax=Mycobacteroides abscessus TaxID=36809 RepID=UPI00078EC95D|nr:hypothetical protein [Mycobacteroides abscessus]AMU64321.1 hypothetical protein A3O04_02730 [Mycobacteroides abscessus]ANO12932.1 hypothetical protein BAB77_02885 [Mycobacteroides abscessus]ARQ67001.1 hypothetical protein CAK77_03155 [Mycobacteroides abscessus subsp. massiliense]MBE5406298.1 hypothetical protein [Mycobacteroides abscessus]MBE5428991.1 hypothetical protein [Mycobacteroides abscessus]